MEPEMKPKEKFKIIELGLNDQKKPRKWRINKFPAQMGCYMAYMLMERFLPGGIEGQIGLSGMPANRKPMTKEEFFELQDDCLSVCFEELPAGSMPVKNANGSWGVLGMEEDAAIVLKLTMHSLMFNVADFLDVNLLEGLMPAAPADSDPQDAPM